MSDPETLCLVSATYGRGFASQQIVVCKEPKGPHDQHHDPEVDVRWPNEEKTSD